MCRQECVRVFSGSGCPNIQEPSNVTVTEEMEGRVLHFECGAGMRRSGPQRLMCDGRRWNSDPPICVRVSHFSADTKVVVYKPHFQTKRQELKRNYVKKSLYFSPVKSLWIWDGKCYILRNKSDLSHTKIQSTYFEMASKQLFGRKFRQRNEEINFILLMCIVF